MTSQLFNQTNRMAGISALTHQRFDVLVIGGGTWFVGAAADWLSTQGFSAPLTTSLLVGDVVTLCCVGCFAWLHWGATNRPTVVPQKNAS